MKTLIKAIAFASILAAPAAAGDGNGGNWLDNARIHSETIAIAGGGFGGGRFTPAVAAPAVSRTATGVRLADSAAPPRAASAPINPRPAAPRTATGFALADASRTR